MTYEARVAFLGSKALGLEVASAMSDVLGDSMVAVIAYKDDDDKRSVLGKFEQLAESNSIPFYTVRTSAELNQVISVVRPSIMLVAGWYRILPVTDLSDFVSFYGIHGSLLPKYRGNAPLVWQVLNGEDEAGVSLFQLAAGMDEGPIVGQSAFAIGPDDTIGDVLEKAKVASASLVQKVLPALVAGNADHVAQDDSGASYGGLRVPAHGRISWEWPSRRVHDFVRSQTHPYPGAFSYLDSGERIIIWRTERDARTYHAVPGSVVERSPEALVVGTGDGVIRVVDAAVELRAGEMVSAIDYVRSLRVRFAA